MRNFTSALFVSLLIGGSVMAQTNLVSNESFEEWSGGKPAHWYSTTTASNGTIEQSSDARTGNSSVLLKGTTSNKRLASEELTLKAGTYTFSVYAKAATAENASARPGYAPINGDGTMGSYSYGDYVNDITNQEWVLVAYTFTLSEQTNLNLVVMNPKSPGKDLLIDDASLTTEDGGIAEGGTEPEPTELYTFKKATSIVSGKKYAIVADNEGTLLVAKNLAASYSYGYLYVDEPKAVEGETISMSQDNYSFTITATDGGYTIVDMNNKYLYMDDSHNSFQVSEEAPAEGSVWSIEQNSDGTFKINNVARNKYIQYSVTYKSYGSYPDEQGLMPMLYEFESNTSGITPDTVTEDLNAPIEVYNINGIYVGNSIEELGNGLYLVKQGNKVTKVIK